MTAPLPDAVGVGEFSLMNDPYLPDVLIAAADDLEPFMLGDVDVPSLNCALPAYLRDAVALIQSQAAQIQELQGLLITHEICADRNARTKLSEIERAHIIKLLGGPLDMSTRDLGSGMTAEAVIALRQKLQGHVRAWNPSVEGDG